MSWQPAVAPTPSTQAMHMRQTALAVEGCASDGPQIVHNLYAIHIHVHKDNASAVMVTARFSHKAMFNRQRMMAYLSQMFHTRNDVHNTLRC